MALKAGDIAGDYKILNAVGSGGMGDVFRAEHAITRRVEAIKVLSGAAGDEQEQRFLREVRLQASLSHPNIAAVYNAFRREDDLLLVMELVEGESLRAILDRGRLPLSCALDYASQVLAAVSYAHSHGIVHRDITPSNIIVTAQGLLKLTDFGLAKTPATPSLSQSGAPMGSPYYMSPEQVRNASDVDGRTDIYSIGAVLYEMVTGRKVFEGSDTFSIMHAHVASQPVAPREIEPQLPPELNLAILTALEKSPDQRFPTAGAFRAVIEHVLHGPAPEPVWRSRSVRMRAAVLGLAAVAGALPVVWYVSRPRAVLPLKPPLLSPAPPPMALTIVPPAPPAEEAPPEAPPKAKVVRKPISHQPRPEANLTPIVVGQNEHPREAPAPVEVASEKSESVGPPAPPVQAVDRDEPQPVQARKAAAAEKPAEKETKEPKQRNRLWRTLGRIFK